MLKQSKCKKSENGQNAKKCENGKNNKNVKSQKKFIFQNAKIVKLSKRKNLFQRSKHNQTQSNRKQG